MAFYSKNKITVSTLVLATVLSTVIAGCSPTSHSETSSEKPNVPFSISKETTYITEPLRENGCPDYMLALNRRRSQGVSPEKNAAVFFWKAVGPSCIPEKGREKFFQMLGIPPLPQDGTYCDCDTIRCRFKDASKPMRAQPTEGDYELACEQEQQASTRPWSAQEFPAFAEWLKANVKPLALIVEASKQPQWYEPCFIVGTTDSGIPIDARIVGTNQLRDCIRWLNKRAMLQLHDQRVDEAWADIIACHRLARVKSLYPFLGSAFETTATEAEKNILRHGDLTAAQIARMRKDLGDLASPSKLADLIDIDWRFELLDRITYVAQKGIDAKTPRRTEITKLVQSWNDPESLTAIDWDTILRVVNSRCDQATAALRNGTRIERQKAIRKIPNEYLMDLKMAAKTCSPDARSDLLGRAFVADMRADLVVGLARDEDCRAMRFDLICVAFALAAYHAEHGDYPPELADLSPKYLSELPKDVYNDEQLHYESESNGYTLYSVGVNGRDDGGKSSEDRFKTMESVDWDDMKIEI